MIPRAEVMAALARVPLFEACSKGDFRIVARHLEVIQCEQGTVLMRQGDRGDAFVVVLEGAVSVWHGATRVDVLGPGDHVGELALLDPAPRNATVVADTEAIIGVLGSRVFRAILRETPAFSERLLRALARRLRDADLSRQG
jgi:CRP/FNR family transcriptional regulator